MEPIVWQTEDYDNFVIERAKTSYGDWTLSQFKPGEYHTRLFNVAEVKFQPAKPDGLTAMDIMDKIKELKESQGEEWTDEKSALWKYISPTELGYGHNLFEARKLVEMLHEGDADLGQPEDILTTADFVFNHEFDNWCGHFRYFNHRSKKPLSLSVSDPDIHLMLDRRGGWYNLMRLGGDHLNDHVRKKMIHVPYPPQVENFRCVGARFVVWLIENRLRRGGSFREPLSEEVQ